MHCKLFTAKVSAIESLFVGGNIWVKYPLGFTINIKTCL